MNAALENLVQQEVTAYRNLCRDTGYQPPDWILPEPSCDLLRKVALLPGTPVHAFEFGSGRSTLALRATCAGVTSVEDSAEWLEKTEEQAVEFPKRDTDLTAVVPLTNCPLGWLTCKSFDIESRPDLLQRLRASRLVLVDSPPNPATREHALLLALRHAPPGAVIILDDLNVSAAFRFSSRLARDNSAHFDFQHIPIDHGLGLFKKKVDAKVVMSPSLREMIGTWMRR